MLISVFLFLKKLTVKRWSEREKKTAGERERDNGKEKERKEDSWTMSLEKVKKLLFPAFSFEIKVKIISNRDEMTFNTLDANFHSIWLYDGLVSLCILNSNIKDCVKLQSFTKISCEVFPKIMLFQKLKGEE